MSPLSGSSQRSDTIPRFAVAVRLPTVAGASPLTNSNDAVVPSELMSRMEKYEYLPSLEWAEGRVASENSVMPFSPGNGAPALFMSPYDAGVFPGSVPAEAHTV
ncbi:unknown [Prevotella sp. CAG:487]|nr:unknown [Prevotella sp. CAG:487]